MTKPAIVVFAYHEIGFSCLDTLINNDEYILAVVTHRNNPDEEIWFRSVSSLAHKYDIPVYTPETVNTQEWTDRIRGWNPELIFSFSYRDRFSEDIIKLPRLGAFTMHDSLLPKYRGGDSINRAVQNGEQETGVTLHTAATNSNAGDIVDQERVAIGVDDTAEDVYRKCAKAASVVLERRIEEITAGSAPRTPQDESQATVFDAMKPDDCRIDWTQTAEAIYNLIRATTHPFPGAFTSAESKRLFVWWAKPLPSQGGTPGQVLSQDPLIIATGSGALELLNAEWEEDDDADVHLNEGQILGS